MYIGYVILGLISLVALFWVLYVLPKDDSSSNDDEDGGTHTGGDSYPVAPPPSIVVNAPNRDPAPPSRAGT